MIDLVLSVVIDLNTKTLTMYKNNTPVIIPVAIGKSSTPTPTGIFSVKRKVKDPIDYSHVTGARIADGTYGDYAIHICNELNQCIGIHGTNDQSSISRRVSAGCVRIGKDDERLVFENIAWYTEIEIK